MRAKTKIEKARQIMKSKPDATVADVMEAAKVRREHAHVLMWRIRKENGGVNIDKVHATTKAKPKFVSVEPIKPIATATDFVNQPPHYKVGNIETIDFIEAKKLNYNLGNVVKYIARADHKGNRDQDLQKAMWYLKRELGLDLV